MKKSLNKILKFQVVIILLFILSPISTANASLSHVISLDQFTNQLISSTGLLDPIIEPVTDISNQLTSGAGPLDPITKPVTDISNQLRDLLNLGPQQDSNTTVHITKTAEADSVESGGTIRYRIVIRNISNTQFHGVQLFDKLPNQVSFVSASGASYDSASHTIIWNLGELGSQAGSIKELLVKIKDNVASGSIIENRATLKAGNLEVTSPPILVTVGGKQHAPFIEGYPDQTFQPEKLITRAEMATIAAKIKGLKPAAQEKRFHDLDRNHWANPFIQSVVQEGIFSGYPDGNFYPDRPITRAEMIAVILRMNGIVAVPFQNEDVNLRAFTDLISSHWAYDAIQTAILLAYVTGYGDGSFQPDKGIKRVEAVVMMNRSLGRGPLVDGETAVEQHFTDVPRTYWEFGWIEEAAKQGHVGVHTQGGERLVRYTD